MAPEVRLRCRDCIAPKKWHRTTANARKRASVACRCMCRSRRRRQTTSARPQLRQDQLHRCVGPADAVCVAKPQLTGRLAFEPPLSDSVSDSIVCKAQHCNSRNQGSDSQTRRCQKTLLLAVW